MSSYIAGLDAAGFMPLPGESEADFIERSEGILACHRDFDEMLEVQGKLTVFDFVEVSKEEKIPFSFWKRRKGQNVLCKFNRWR